LLFLRAAFLSTVRLASQLLAGWLGAAIVLAAPAFAEDAPRRVGSLNYVSGEVSYVLRAEPGEPNGSDAENWLQADFDQPVCQDMSLKRVRWRAPASGSAPTQSRCLTTPGSTCSI
jgi:hypothetical protein